MKLTRLHTGPRYHHYQRRMIKVKWIRPQDGLPELKNTNEKYSGIYSDVVLIYRNGSYYVAYLHSVDGPEDGFWIAYDADKEFKAEDITCWAPIVPPPKECLGDDVP